MFRVFSLVESQAIEIMTYRMRNFYPFSVKIFSPQNGGFRRARLGKSRGMIRDRKRIF